MLLVLLGNTHVGLLGVFSHVARFLATGARRNRGDSLDLPAENSAVISNTVVLVEMKHQPIAMILRREFVGDVVTLGFLRLGETQRNTTLVVVWLPKQIEDLFPI